MVVQRLGVWSIAVLAAAALLLSTARAADFLVMPAEGSNVSGELLRIEDGRVVIAPRDAEAADDAAQPQTADEAEQDEHSFALADLYRLERLDPPRARPLGRTALLVLANGDRLPVRVLQSDDAALTVLWDAAGTETLSVPLETVRAVVLDPPADRAALERLVERLSAATEPNDRALLTNGDAVFGTLVGLEGAHIHFDTAGGQVALERGDVAAIAMNPELISFPPADGPGAILWLADGSRVEVDAIRTASNPSGTGVSPVAERIIAHARFGHDVELAVDDLLAAQFVGGRVRYLSELEPADYTHTPYIALAWPYLEDRSVTGRPMRLRGREFARGIGMHSQSSLTYPLGGQFRFFRATIGIDDEAGSQGSVVFRVLSDGRQCYASDVLRGGAAPVDTGPIDVAGAHTLTLVVEFADWGDIQDHADWADARLLE